MAWSESRAFRSFVNELVTKTTQFDLDTDTIKVALYKNTITPDCLASSFSYNTGEWLASYEVKWDAGSAWPTGGVSLSGKSVTNDTNKVKWSASSTTTAANATLTDFAGCLVYDAQAGLSNKGICFNFLGGTNTVIDGTLTIIWSTNGIMTFSV